MTKRRLDMKKTKSFLPVRWKTSQISFVGGHCTKPRLVHTIFRRIGRDKYGLWKLDTRNQFVKLSSTEDWLCKAVFNSLAWKNITSLISDLRAKVKTAWWEEPDDPGLQDDEPVLRFPAFESPESPYNSAKRRRCVPLPATRILNVTMPSKCPEEEPTCESTKTVRLLLVDHQHVWMHIEDVDWAVRYMYFQHEFAIGNSVSDGECSSPDKGIV